mmetsp:Transcript_25307/g.54991  ORF Transcript_25307/g.54991 Transcript_25307/m.54991 type:complete len:294 (-) Transcript_25307:518-1399(-)
MAEGATNIGRRIAYVVLPTYDWSELGDANVIATLVKCRLLPKQLKTYGREADAAAFRASLEGLGFEVTCAACYVDRAGFKKQVMDLAAACTNPNDVFALVFCGHGEQQLMTRHASMVFSDNKCMSSYLLDHLLAGIACKASVYTVLNCCTAMGVPMAYPIGTMLSSVEGHAAVDIATLGGAEPNLAGQRRVEVYSTSHLEAQKPREGGTLFARAFAEVFAVGGVRLEDLEASLSNQLRQLSKDSTLNPKNHVPPTVKVLRYNYVGPAFEPLQEETKAAVAEKMRTMRPYSPTL